MDKYIIFFVIMQFQYFFSIASYYSSIVKDLTSLFVAYSPIFPKPKE